MARINTGISGGLRRTPKRGIGERLVQAWVFNDRELFEGEQRKVFGCARVRLSYTSEIPQAGNCAPRYVANNPYVVPRDEDGPARALLDMCRHWAMRLCWAELGEVSCFPGLPCSWTHCSSERLGYSIELDPLELGSFTWQPVKTSSRRLATPDGSNGGGVEAWPLSCGGEHA